MGSTFPSVAQVIASSTTDISSLAGFLSLPVIFLAFVFVVVTAGIIYFRKGLLGVIRKVTGMGRRGGRRRRR